MILEELTLHNFGVYRDRQVCSLATTKSKPIVLIGGLNGAGKSTFMDAIQLALYGKRARCSNRGRLSYEEYLKRSIHERGRPSDGAGIELQFRYRSQGEDHTYRVSRYWTSNGSVKERLAVLHDGVHSRSRRTRGPNTSKPLFRSTCPSCFSSTERRLRPWPTSNGQPTFSARPCTAYWASTSSQV